MRKTHLAVSGILFGIILGGCVNGRITEQPRRRPQRQPQRQTERQSAPDSSSIRFGLHAAGAPRNVTSLKSQATRHLVQWDQIEPSRGLYRFGKVVKGLNEYAREGIDVCVTLRCNSQWACEFDYGQTNRTYDQKSSPPKNWQDWRNFVTKVVESFDGDGIDDQPGIQGAVKAWQVDNEFALQWKGSGDDLIKLMRVTYETIKAADPEAIVVTPGFFPVARWALRDGVNTRGWVYVGSTDQSRERLTSDDFGRRRGPGHDWGLNLFKEAGNYFDAVDIHIYASSVEDMQYQVEWVKRQFQANQLRNKEIWSLEYASPFHEFNESKFNRHVIQMQVAGFAAGLDRIYWSSVLPTLKHPKNFQRLSLLSNPTTPKTAAYNYALVAEQLHGFTSVSEVQTPGDASVYRFEFGDSGKIAWVAWSNQNGEQGGGNRDNQATKWNLDVDQEVTVLGMVPPGSKKPSFRKVLSPSKGKVAIDLSEDPIFIVRQP